MSEEDAKAFLKKVSEDKDLQEKLKGADSEEKFLAIAKASGFDFTKEEWLAVIPIQTEGELSEDDLGKPTAGDGGRGSVIGNPYWPCTNKVC